MRLILEKEEIIRILGEHFELDLDLDKIYIRTEPNLEIELSGIPLPSAEPSRTSTSTTPEAPKKQEEKPSVTDPAAELYSQRHTPNALPGTPPPGIDDDMQSVIRSSRAIENSNEEGDDDDA